VPAGRESPWGDVLGHFLQRNAVGKTRRIQRAVDHAGLHGGVELVLRHDLRGHTQALEGLDLLAAAHAQLLALELVERAHRLAAKQRCIHNRKAQEAGHLDVPLGNALFEHGLERGQRLEVLVGIGHQAIDVQIGQRGRIAADEGRPDEAQLGRAHLHEAQRIGVFQAQSATLGNGDLQLAAGALFHVRCKRFESAPTRAAWGRSCC
jgi:hypothetical protein